jgi:hypothetical protein
MWLSNPPGESHQANASVRTKHSNPRPSVGSRSLADSTNIWLCPIENHRFFKMFHRFFRWERVRSTAFRTSRATLGGSVEASMSVGARLGHASAPLDIVD